MLIDFDLKNSPLYIRTNSVTGSNEAVTVFFFNTEGDTFTEAGGVSLRLTSPPHYWIHFCSASNTSFLTDLPSETDKVWKITLTETTGTRVMVRCNKVKVLDVLLSEDTCSNSDWNSIWGPDVVKIKFTSSNSIKLINSDTASDFYSALSPFEHGSFSPGDLELLHS